VCRWHTSVVTTVIPEIARHSPRNGFNGFLRALLGDRALLPPSPAKISFANLTPASGRQDHTTSPSASSAARLHRHPRPPHPALYVRDDRETPLCEAGRGELVEMICPTLKAEYFSQKDWTTQITLIRLNKSPVSRNGLRRRGACHRARVRATRWCRARRGSEAPMTRARTHKSGLVGAACSMPARPRDQILLVAKRRDVTGADLQTALSFAELNPSIHQNPGCLSGSQEIAIRAQ
jgi:hypothetical protein